jgi:hypothetical protein
MMATWLADVLRGAGLRVEEVAGWQDRGHGELRDDVANIVDVSHHTAGGAYGRAPSLSTCLYGVPGVPGPLCNVLQTREDDGNDAFMVIAAGTSYNAGTGGFVGVSGNFSTIGTECEHVGTIPFPPHRALLRQRAAAAILTGLGQSSGARSCQHFEWSDTGKIDIGTPEVDAGAWRARITEFMHGAPTPPTPGADDMANTFIGRKSDELRPPELKAGIFVSDGLFPTWKRHVEPEEWQLAKDIAKFAGVPEPTVHKLTDQHWDSIPTGHKD